MSGQTLPLGELFFVAVIVGMFFPDAIGLVCVLVALCIILFFVGMWTNRP
jgi:F0F1-type ATP synthase membrane subunit c/vacuolar-type H+-ATPase subunit K